MKLALKVFGAGALVLACFAIVTMAMFWPWMYVVNSVTGQSGGMWYHIATVCTALLIGGVQIAAVGTIVVGMNGAVKRLHAASHPHSHDHDTHSHDHEGHDTTVQ